MRTMTPVEEKMKKEAEFGAFNAYYLITLKKAAELRNQGFVVTDSKEQKGSPRLHKIDWSNAGERFKEANIAALNENCDDYSAPEKLWIISSKVKEDPVNYYRKH